MTKRARRLVLLKDAFDLRDRISQLPDDVRVSILSRLTLREAVRTGILSKQWQHLWKRVTILDFNADESLGILTEDARSDKASRAYFVNWVNCVITQMQSQTTVLNELRICFYLNRRRFITAMDNWVEFAFKRRVQKLILDFDPLSYDFKPYYSFPVIPRQVNILTGFECLKDLSLRYVNVCDEALEGMLSHCLFLEYLSIYVSVGLKNVKICGSSLNLKHVGIYDCDDIVSVEISNAPKLVSFEYCRIAELKLDNVPMLEKILIGVRLALFLRSVLPILSFYSSQLRVLTLDIVSSPKDIASLDIPQFPNLQVLVIRQGVWWNRSILILLKVVRACPNLPKFVLELVWHSFSKKRKCVIETPKCELKSLRSLEIKGYFGRKCEVELVSFFIENAPSLENIVINPQNSIGEAAVARRHAMRHIRPKVPSGVDLWFPEEADLAITDATYSCDGRSVYIALQSGGIRVLAASSLKLKCKINTPAFLNPSLSSSDICATSIASNPKEPNQFVLGLTDGGICVLEPKDGSGGWGDEPPPDENVASTSNVATAAG